MPSENGWEPARLPDNSPLLIWKTVPGSKVTLRVMRGFPEVFLLAWAADWNAYIEPLRDADSASYTETNSVATSNHLNGTAVDLNWNSHPFRKRGSLNAQQMATIAEMEAFYEGWMFWAGRWDDPIDEMHSQMGYDTWNRNPAGFDFIARKIRSDGFSTFRRGPLPGDPTPPATVPAGNTTPAPADGAATVLYDAVPVIDEARAAQLLPAIVAGLAQAECTTVSRIAMALAQWGHESDGFKTTEEYASGAAYEGRADLGNTQPGDGVRFKGRTWIQITGRGHYANFGKWCAAKGLISDPDYFVKNSTALGDLKWAGIGAAWYWTTQRPINALIDAGDAAVFTNNLGTFRGAMNAVTAAINGGQNGIDDRRTRYSQAAGLGNRLLLLTAPAADQGDDLLSALPADLQQKVAEAILRIDANVTWLRNQLDATDFGPSSSMGKTADGRELTVRDGLAEDKRNVEDLLAALTAPGIAVVQLQAAPAAKK